MPDIICCECGECFFLHHKNLKQLVNIAPTVCSPECLKEQIRRLEEEQPVVPSGYVYPSILEQPFDCWDDVTKRFYRSSYEVKAARFFLRENIVAEYERYTIMFNGRASYTPDFFLPKANSFVEIKGLWNGSAKGKVRKTIKLGIPLLLIPDYLARRL